MSNKKIPEENKENKKIEQRQKEKKLVHDFIKSNIVMRHRHSL